jgi:cytochrome o ubiquinol oxidase operon protein cyoD
VSEANTQKRKSPGIFKPYLVGFLLSILLTLAAYAAVAEHLLTGWVLVFALTVLALLQAGVQLLFFLHLGRESKPRWNLVVFLFMVLVLVIIVFGSLWIIHNLNYRVM